LLGGGRTVSPGDLPTELYQAFDVRSHADETDDERDRCEYPADREDESVPTQSLNPPNRSMFLSQRTQPARTVIPDRVLMTVATLRFFTTTVSNGPALGPTSAAEGPMNALNRKADPTQRIPATICRKRNTSMNRSTAPSSTL
jgi:hypothetical protein